MLTQFTWFDLCKTFLERRSFCELVMMSQDKRGVCGNDVDMTDEQFQELQYLAHINLLRGCKIDDIGDRYEKS